MSPPLLTVFGDHGSFSITRSGLPVGPVPPEYAYIRKVDLSLPHVRKWLAAGAERLDVVTLGCWVNDGPGYEPCVEPAVVAP